MQCLMSPISLLWRNVTMYGYPARFWILPHVTLRIFFKYISGDFALRENFESEIKQNSKYEKACNI